MGAEARILLVDDELDLVWAVWHSLEDEGYEVLTVSNGAEALALIETHHPDLVILDIIMPGFDGLQVCRKLRRRLDTAAVPVLFLTARAGIEDRVVGLDEGGDDYLTKPFDLRELKARVRSLLRRARPAPGEDKALESRDTAICVGDLILSLEARRVQVGERTIQLTPTEFDLLHYLVTHAGQILASRDLYTKALDYPDALSDSSLVRWHIKNLREKIEPDPTQPTYIRTIPHQGYILERASALA